MKRGRRGCDRMVVGFSNDGFAWLMVFNATHNNISVILWLSVLLMEETGVSEKKI
jgi:hypothetical protein